MAIVSGSVNYKDSTPIPEQQEYTPDNIKPIAIELSKFIRTKMYGTDVRESLARWIEIMLAVQTYINEDETAFKVNIQNQQDSVEDRQTQVEGTMSDVINQFKAVISNVTKDSEVALARDSVRFGDYTVLDDRLEYIESWLAAHVPAGFHVSIKHNQNRQPKVVVHYYEYAIGTEAHGLGTGPYGLGETSTQTISCTVDYRDDDTSVINLPLAYALTGIVTYNNGYWYLIDGYKTLRFDLGDGIDDSKALSGNGSNETSTNANGGGYAGDLGLSSYQIAVKNGFSGNISQWLASLVGPKGEKGDPGSAVVGKNTVLAENIVKDTISPDEVGFVSRAILSNTLVDDAKIQKGGYYDYTNGAWTVRADYNSTGLIPCVPGQSYTRVLFVGQITYYDKNESFVVGDNPSQTRTFKVPDNSNISYMRLAFAGDESSFTVNSGTELLGKDSYKEEFSIDLNLDIDNKIKDLEIDVSEIKDNADGLMPVITSNNLVDKSIIKLGGYYDFTNGTWKDRADINSTGFISCKPQDTFVASSSGKYIGGNVTFWNKKGEYVSGIDVSAGVDSANETSFTVPENYDIASFKMSFTKYVTDSYIINKGTDILQYDEYKLEYVYNKDIASPNIKLIEESLHDIKTTLGLTLQSFNSIGDISTMQYRAENYKTTFWLTKINRDTFNGGKIKPKVRLTSSSVDSGDPKSVLDYITNHDAMCCINAGVFDVTSGIVDGRLIIDGAIIKDSAPVIHKNQWTLGIKSDGSLSAYDSTISASAMLKDGCESAVTGFVPIIMNGSMVDKSLFLTFEHLTKPNPRQVICQNALGDYFVFSCAGREDGEEGLTLEQIGEILLYFGVTFAYNLDGGGSTQTFVKKKRINKLIENRPIPSIIVFE